MNVFILNTNIYKHTSTLSCGWIPEPHAKIKPSFEADSISFASLLKKVFRGQKMGVKLIIFDTIFDSKITISIIIDAIKLSLKMKIKFF